MIEEAPKARIACLRACHQVAALDGSGVALVHGLSAWDGISSRKERESEDERRKSNTRKHLVGREGFYTPWSNHLHSACRLQVLDSSSVSSRSAGKEGEKPTHREA